MKHAQCHVKEIKIKTYCIEMHIENNLPFGGWNKYGFCLTSIILYYPHLYNSYLLALLLNIQ